MTSEQYIRFRGIQKVAAGKGASFGATALSALKSLIGGVANTGKKVAETAIKGSGKAMAVALPTTGLLGAWLLYKTTSPKAVAEMAPEFATHAIERESLLQSMRDLEQAEMTTQIKRNKRRVHDQFL